MNSESEQKTIDAFVQLLRDKQDTFATVSDQHLADLVQQIEDCSQEQFTEKAYNAIKSFCSHYPALRETLFKAKTNSTRGPANTGYSLPDDNPEYKQKLLILINAMRVNQPSKSQDDVKERLKDDSTKRTS